MQNEFGVRGKVRRGGRDHHPQADFPGFRHDLFFYIHNEDIPKFAVKRLM